MKSALTVFVCSTFSDLSEERGGVLDAIRRLQLQHDSMEFFGARADQPIETCLAEVRRSNILVVIVGHRYGTIVPEMDFSFSEAEYREGYRLNKPCLVYIKDENIPILPRHMERDPKKLQLLENWKTTLQERHTVASFKDKNDLAVQVAADISRTISDLEEAERAKSEANTESPVHLIEEVNKLITDAITKGANDELVLSSIRRTISAIISDIEKVKATVFLSYSSNDKAIAAKFADGLKSFGLKVWFDEQNIKWGSDFVREIERGLDAADYIVFFISPSSIESNWVQKEWQLAMHQSLSTKGGPKLLPILLEPAELPPLMRTIQYLDMTDGDVEKAIVRLIEVIKHYSERNNVD